MPGAGNADAGGRGQDQRPAWLVHAHAALDRAVWAAYGWDDPDPDAVPDDTILERLLALNLARSKQDVS